MQAFWVRVNEGVTNTSFTVTNAMRSHADVFTNKLKAPSAQKMSQQVLKLKVSNGINADEAIVYFDANASNAFDAYDSPKMSNANVAMPEIYTLAGNEDVVINGLNSIAGNEQLPLGFNTSAADTFTLEATEASNFDPDTRVILKDKLLNAETDITDGTPYRFSSEVTNTTSRFSVIFRTGSITTGAEANVDNESLINVSQNRNGQIVVDCPNGIAADARVTVYNAVGQMLENEKPAGTSTVLGRNYNPGVYLLRVAVNGKNIVRKVVIK
jgi:hypothetical protein